MYLDVCSAAKVMAKDSRFQALKEAYKDRHFDDNYLATALQLCRDYHDYDDDWYPVTPAQRGVFTRFINFYLTYAKASKTSSDLTKDSLYNLYATLYALYSPEQLDNRVAMLSRDFRELVDRLEAADKTGRSRQELIKLQGDDKKNGFVRIMEKVFSIYENDYTVDKLMERFNKRKPNATEAEKEAARKHYEYVAQEYKTILANKERLSAIAATRIGEEEGFVVNIRDFQVSFEELSEEDQLTDPDNQENNETTGEDKEEGSKGERYGDFRVLKLMNTLSSKAKRLLSKIPKVDSSGKVMKDDLGVKQFVGGRQAAVVLNKVLVNSSPETMLSDLKDAANSYPWITGLIKELTKNTDAQTTIYDNFKKAQTTYVYVNSESQKEKVKYGDESIDVWTSHYVPHIANSRSAGNALAREAGMNLQAGYVLDEATSIYTGYGSLKSRDAIEKLRSEFDAIKKRVQADTGAMWIRMVDGDAVLGKKYLETLKENADKEGKSIDHLYSVGEESMKLFLDANPDIPGKLASMLRGMGFDVSEEDVKNIAMQTMTRKGFSFLAGKERSEVSARGHNKLYQLVEYMGSVYGRAEELYKQDLPTTGQYLYNTSNGFRWINRCLALAQYRDVEARVVNEGKSLSTYNNVNLLHQTFDLLTNKAQLSEEKYRDTIRDEFLQYEGMSLGYGKYRRPVGWLKDLIENTGNIRSKMDVCDIAAFNHVEYAGLSRQQKLTNSLVMFMEASNTFQTEKYAAYEVPIQADYSTAYNFVVAPRLSEEEIVDALTDEVLIELERISAIERRQSDNNRVKLKVYEDQGKKFQIFPAFNTNGFREEYVQKADPDSARAFVKEQVRKQLQEVVDKDVKTVEESGMLTNPNLKKINLGYKNYGSAYSENNKIGELDEKVQQRFREWFLNTFYAREQMIKLITGGIEQFNGLIDYEKRNMLTHATRTSLYTKATWKGKPVGKESQNVVYIEDDKAASAFYEDIKEMLNELLKQKVIDKHQFDTMLGSYSKITTTDGQGFRTLDSYRIVQIMADQWDDAHEEAYQNIKKGLPTSKDIELFMQNIKPVLTGYEEIPAAAGTEQKPIKLTVLHKYSEQVLLPMELAKYCLQTQSVPLQALENAQKRLKKQGKEIDMFLFHSCVKVGAHSVLQPFAKWKDIKGDKAKGETDEEAKKADEEARKAHGWNGEPLTDRILKDAKSIEDYIVQGVTGRNSTMHVIPFKYYGIAASTPAHAADDKIAWASQAEKVAWANIAANDKIKVRGVDKNAAEARELYNGIKTANIIESYKKLRETFTDSDELEKMFQEELASKSYSSREMQYALAHLADGSFAIPLFSPNIEHQVQELLASVIKKRLTKSKVKGANILQSTGLGMDIEASSFDNTNALSEEDKLKIVFEGTGENKHIKYVEVYMPIHDSRLKLFADKNGNIGPERLRKLIEDGTIPESMLEFIAYRTPSDAEHSVIPCRIKGFYANTGGATIKMPKEIMVMTGHDYDGDKMRCHFKDFRLVDKEGNEVDLSDADIVKMMLGQKAVNPSWKKCEVYEYDYDATPLENSLKARNNARVELMFAQLTSPAGSRRVLIPGGCDESKVMAKTLYLVRASSDEAVKNKLSELLGSPVGSTTSLYNTLVNMSDDQLTGIIREVSGLDTPYTVTHAADAYDYIMGGAEMIGIYALYNSALQMMQRLNMNYVPKLTEKGKEYTVSIFHNPDGSPHVFGKLFDVKNHDGKLASLGLARLLNAAVDNNKDPVLGYLNQTKEMAEMTFLMFAAGMTEEEIHLYMNQPAVIELINRLKSRNNKGLVKEAQTVIQDLAGDNAALAQISDPASGPWYALPNVAKMTKDDFTVSLATKYSELKDTNKQKELFNDIYNQICLLQTLVHLNPAAENLARFVRLTRPESESGAIGTSIADITAKVIALNEFRDTLNVSSENDLRISGMKEVLAKRDVHEGWDTSYIEDILGLQLPEVVALNSLMIDSSLGMFKTFFPTAKQSWIDMAASIAEKYSYRTVQEGTIKKIGEEMILWKLLSNKKFIQGDPQAEQKRIIVDVPKQVKDLKERIAKAEQERGKDPAADALIGNAFLMNLTASWGAMLSSSEEAIRKLAIDLFKYNLYTNGFSYGMYEFAHFAPFSVLMSTPNYIEALKDILKSEWKDERDCENFTHQYCMNHWGDKSFLPKINVSSLSFVPVKDGSKGTLWLSKRIDENTLHTIYNKGYVILTSGQNNSEQTLYRVEPGNADAVLVLEKAEKLGVRNRNQQVTLQYNPTQGYKDVKPVVAGNTSAWGQLDVLEPTKANNINAPGQRSMDPEAWTGIVKTAPLGVGFFGLENVVPQMQELEQKAVPAIKKNAQALEEAPKTQETDTAPSAPAAPLPLNPAFASMGAGVDLAALQAAAVRTVSAEEEASGKMFNIVRRTEEGKVISEMVPGTPNNIREARKQQVFVDLNNRLREILRSKGIAVGVLTDVEARMAIGGVADFDTANVTAEGLLEMIRIANGYQGEYALPEEFAHMALEMLGHDHVLVSRLLNALRNSNESMEEAYDGMYQEYISKYGENNKEKLVLEAAGKLVAKNLLRQQEIQSSPVKRLVYRIVDSIKNLFRKFSIDEVQNAIFDANQIASKIAREMLGGKLLDQMSLENIGSTGQFLSVQKDLTGKNDILNKLLKTETKRLSILNKRLGYTGRDKKTPAVQATELQIKKLESAIRNYKTEDAIVTYLNDSLAFLAATEQSLDDAVNSGRPMNSICQKLNTVRDTLYSFSRSIEDIREAIVDKEIQDSAGLTASLDQVAGVLAKFHDKYMSLARTYFEEMLSSVYGEHGKTVEIGKNKGKVISIHDMARKADGDISLAARWFNSIADCNDYVLKAVDDIARDAKIRARRKAIVARPKIEQAVADLVRETGSRDLEKTARCIVLESISPKKPQSI